ncbi:hypothetical protein MES5069_290006 [Mesorhizobium escarrei]|uniref:Uncharacterized protein n=1 Tax=Mesorhizobium escarrei TaxID=666018 RepID=A0ABN8JVE0_9HYPH|nr:hypothetical protein MES5069_290006 [Mesorhizobium escarrei]
MKLAMDWEEASSSVATYFDRPAPPLIALPGISPRKRGERAWPQPWHPFCNACDWRNPMRRRPSPRLYTGRSARQGDEGQRFDRKLMNPNGRRS